MRAIVLVAHGSRDPAAIAEIEGFSAACQQRWPGEVALAYVELVRPALSEVLAALVARGATEIVAVPLFLFTARHLKNELPLALAGARLAAPHVRFIAAQPLGVHPSMVAVAFERAEALEPITVESAARTAVVFLGRGSSDPDANGELYKLARLFSEGRGFASLQPAFVSITAPSLETALEQVARARPERILVLPYLLFSGLLIERIRTRVEQFRQRTPWIRSQLAPHLAEGPQDRLIDHLALRIDEAVRGRDPLPCDNCQYRVPLAGLTGEVGGLKALLWSVRHSVTHTQGAPHVHAHKALSRHVLVCGNADCADRGSLTLLSALRRRLKDVGRERDIKVTRTGCMGRCGEGPTVAVYPDGIWYRGVTATDAEELVSQHLIGGVLVGRLVDQIMQ